MATCDHCLIDFPEREAVQEGGNIFCCNGCMGIYGLIHSEGLDGFYERRGRWSPGPAREGDF